MDIINKKELIDYARQEIRRFLKMKTEYSHNIISSYLRQVANRYGKVEADKLIDELRLETVGIRKKEHS